GKGGLLNEFHAHFLPVQLRGDEEIDVDTPVIMEINGVVSLGKFFDACSRATKEGIKWRAKSAVEARSHGDEIHHHAIGILRAQARIEKQSFVIVHDGGIAREPKKVAAQFHHVVTAAALFRIGAQLSGNFSGVLPELIIACAAGAVGMLGSDFLPEVVRDVEITLFAGKFITAYRADDLGNIRVGMIAAQSVAVLRQRIKDFLVVETAGKIKILFLAGDTVKIEEHFVHATMLDELHASHVFVGEGIDELAGPFGHSLRHIQRFLI